ncbi:4'-phosphopantetheinyl transferase [Pedobacter sp. UYEF25]
MMLNKCDWVDFERQTINLDCTSIFKIKIPDVLAEVRKYYGRLLSEDEKIKANRFRFLADLERFSTARIALKLLLKHLSGASADEIVLELSKNGKPSFRNLEFNLAHSGDYVLIALSNKPIGIDVEIPKEHFDFSVILKNTFSVEEINYINQNQNSKKSFLILWTRKEALLKATGEGLTEDLPTISVLNNTIKRMDSTYNLHSFKINDSDIASVALNGALVRLSTYNILPSFFTACVNE